MDILDLGLRIKSFALWILDLVGVSVQTTRAGAALRTCSAQVTAASKSGFEKSEE